MTDTIKISRELLETLVDAAENGTGINTDDLMTATGLLAAPPADAADMGGQAEEEVKVVAHLMRPDFMEPYVSIRRDCSGVFVEQLMTVAQHRRILAAEIQKRFDGNEQSSREHSEELAQHRQQAGKLVEALRQVRGYTDSPHVVGVIDEALADWEKTQ